MHNNKVHPTTERSSKRMGMSLRAKRKKSEKTRKNSLRLVVVARPVQVQLVIQPVPRLRRLVLPQVVAQVAQVPQLVLDHQVHQVKLQVHPVAENLQRVPLLQVDKAWIKLQPGQTKHPRI